MKRIIFVSLLLLACFSSYYFYFQNNKTPKAEIKTAKLRIISAIWPGFLPMIIAKEKGYFTEEGVDVEYTFTSSAMKMRMDFEAGYYDGAFYNFSSFLVMDNIQKQKIILSSDLVRGGAGVVARKEIKTAYDLKNKKVSTTLTSFSEFFIMSMLQKFKLAEGDIHWVPRNSEAEAVENLRLGKVDAAFLWEPFYGQTLRNGANSLYSIEEVLPLLINALGVHESTYETKRKELKAFLKAWFRAVEFCQKNESEAIQIIAKELKIKPSDISFKFAHLNSAKENLEILDNKTNPQGMYRSSEEIFKLQHYKNVRFVPVDLSKVIEPSLIKEILQ